MKQILTNTFDGWLGQTNIKMMRWTISEKTWFDIDLKWIYIFQNIFLTIALLENQCGFHNLDMTRSFDSESSPFLRYLRRFARFSNPSPFWRSKQKDWRSPQLVPISTQKNTVSKNVKTSFWMDRQILFFFWGGGGYFVGMQGRRDVVGRISWVCKFVRLLYSFSMFERFQVILIPYVWSQNLNKFQSRFHVLKQMIIDTDVICVCKDIFGLKKNQFYKTTSCNA